MKKGLLVGCIFVIFFMAIEGRAADVYIPDEAIRFRVIPNSNTALDQTIKNKVRDNIQPQLYDLLKDEKSSSDARSLIQRNLASFEDTVEHTLSENGSEESYELQFGTHYFPEKKYKGVIYPAGYYESLVVTLGKGEGDNWWCVLFPPLCLLEAEETEAKGEVEYKSFVKELIERFF